MRICVFYSVLVVLHFKTYHIVAFKDLSTGHTFSLKFFPLRFYCFLSEAKNNYWIFPFNFWNNNYLKRKKRKKKKAVSPSGGFQKSKFFKKKYYHPDIPYGCRIMNTARKVVIKRYGWWRFFLKPAGLELAFL